MGPDHDEEAIEYEGRILLLDEDFDEENALEVGRVWLRTVEAFYTPGTDNENAYDAMDAIDEDCEFIGRILQEHLDEAAPDGILGLLVVDNIWVVPAYRGRGIATHVLWAILNHWSRSATPDHATAVLYAWDKPDVDAKWERFDEANPEEFRDRMHALHTLFARTGFKCVANTDVVLFPLERELPVPSASVYVIQERRLTPRDKGGKE